MTKIPKQKKVLLALVGGSVAVLGLVVIFARQTETAHGQYDEAYQPLQATCTVKQGSVVFGSGETATFDVTASGGTGNYGNYSFKWTYPSDIANCASSTYVDECTTGPLSRSIMEGEFSVEVSSSEPYGQYSETTYAYCPGVPLVAPATVINTNVSPIAIGPFGNKDGNHYCPSGTVAIGFRKQPGTGGDSYQHVQLLCAPMNATGTTYIGPNYSDGTTYKIDSSKEGGSGWCKGSDLLVGAEWAKNGQIDFGRCIVPRFGFALRNGYESGSIDAGIAQCNSGDIATAFQNHSGKNDAWGNVYCGQPYVKVPQGGGTINVTSEAVVNTVSAVTTRPYSSAIPPQPQTGWFGTGHSNPAFCPEGTIVSGIRSGGLDNKGTVKANQPLCGSLTSAAQSAGLQTSGPTSCPPGYALDTGNGSSGCRIDSATEGSEVGPCPAGYVVNGGEWGDSSQLDYGECQPLTSSQGNVTLGTPTFITATQPNTDYYCPTSSLVVAGQNAPQKNDSWNGFYCASVSGLASSTPVPSDWSQGAFLYNGPDKTYQPCDAAPCSGTQQTYTNAPYGIYNLFGSNVTLLPSAGNNWALRSIEQAPIAAKKIAPLFSLSFLPDLLNVAQAATTCGYYTGFASNCTATSTTWDNFSLTLGPSTPPQGNFIILWDPVARICLNYPACANPTTIQLSTAASSTTSTVVTITNSGATGSTLNWTASSSAPWLTVWPTSGHLNAGGKAAKGCSDTNGCEYLTVTANARELAVGTYRGTVTFNGTSTPTTSSKPPAQQTVAVTLTVGAASPPPPPSNPPSCTFGASPQQIVPPAPSTLSWSCTNAASCTLSGGEFGSGQGEFTSGSASVSPTTNTTYTLSCQGSSSGPANTVTASTTVTTRGSSIREINPG